MFISKIKKVLKSSLLLKDLHYVPTCGASEEQIKREEVYLKHNFITEHKTLLKEWNGINLDIIKFFGCYPVENSIPILRENQFDFLSREYLVIGNDPSGFLYIQSTMGKIVSIDTDGGNEEKVANSLEDFICNYLFGNRAWEFGGDDWVDELKRENIF